MSEFLFTSESVTEGHPDKLCDQVSDGILDAILKGDKGSRVACETLTKTGFVMVAGEVTSSAQIDIPKIVRGVVKEIGYSDSAMGFDWQTCGVMVALEQQSPDIAQGVDGKGVYTRDEQGAGDQGMMFGYACDETPELMPLPITPAHKLSKKLADVRKKGMVDFLRPDGKSQVSVRYSSDDRPLGIDAVVVSTQHSEEVKYKTLKEAVMEEVVRPALPAALVSNKTKFFINPTGRFVVGGPMGDSGLTGRKIIVDTYGGMGRHGGGAFSGKDPSKVDRSACYYARYIAKNVVAAGLARRCEVQVAYAIGVAEPVSLLVHTFGTGKISEDRLAEIVRANFDCRPGALIRELNLLRPIYQKTAAYGHFGRQDADFFWEKTNKADALKSAARKFVAANGHVNGSASGKAGGGASAAPTARSRSERGRDPRPAQCGAAGMDRARGTLRRRHCGLLRCAKPCPSACGASRRRRPGRARAELFLSLADLLARLEIRRRARRCQLRRQVGPYAVRLAHVAHHRVHAGHLRAAHGGQAPPVQPLDQDRKRQHVWPVAHQTGQAGFAAQRAGLGAHPLGGQRPLEPVARGPVDAADGE